MSLQETHQEMR